MSNETKAECGLSEQKWLEDSSFGEQIKAKIKYEVFESGPATLDWNGFHSRKVS